MDSKILLGKILQKFKDQGFSKYADYNSFGYLAEDNNSITVSRENGDDTKIPFAKILIAIEAYKHDSNLYGEGPSVLREFGITHITSPIFSMTHLLSKNEYER